MTTPEAVDKNIKPIIVMLTQVELGGGSSIVADIIKGTYRQKKDYLRAISQVTKIVRGLAPLHRVAIPAGATLSVIEGGIYTADQDVFYKFHFYPEPDEELEPAGF